jgi:citrate lyase subunit beta/citryl-CoA lyase
MRGAPDIVALPKVSQPAEIVELAEAAARFERDYGLAEGSTTLLPNIEFAKGLVQLAAIAAASPRVNACLIASEDLAADLGAERGQDGLELAYARQRFLVECVAAGAVAVDCPYTWADVEGVEQDTRWARRLGYKAKSAVAPEHAGVINRVLTPSDAEIARARLVVDQFEAARAQGLSRIAVDGSLVEVPIYLNCKRLLARAKELGDLGRHR